MFKGYPPGTILTLMYLNDRIKDIPPGKFVEIGPGTGAISKLLLMHGWSGIGIDIQPKAILHIKNFLSKEIADGKYLAMNANFLEVFFENVDLVISCNVMEHLTAEQEVKLLEKSREILSPKGKFIAIVPSSMKYWSIEDEIAGHLRRYERGYMEKNLSAVGFDLFHVAAITYPISNILLPISSLLVNKYESNKLGLSVEMQTALSGIRDVPFKTHFPRWASTLLNSFTFYPLHAIQKLFINKKDALTLFYECTIK